MSFEKKMDDRKFMCYAPEIDAIVEKHSNRQWNHFEDDADSYESEEIIQMLHRISDIVQCLKPKEKGIDKIWSVWIQAKRGPLSVFVDDEEYEEMKEAGEVESIEDLQELWKSFYPEEIQWYEVSFVLYEKKFFVIFDSKLEVKLDLETEKLTGAKLDGKQEITFLTWLSTTIKQIVNRVRKDAKEYNQFLSEQLPFRKRVGKIKRMTLWEQIKDVKRLDEEFGWSNLKKFEKVVAEMDKKQFLYEMTADDFFRYCSICYDANDYFDDDNSLTPKDKYIKMADGRDEGLREIQGDSQKAFMDWYTSRFQGGHPWEICRGGNSTHISLMVSKEQDGWRLYLHGSSRIRCVETAKMAIALYEHNIPYALLNAEQMVHMLKGEDDVGIVPEDVIPRYCHSYFPDKDNIHDFINPWHDDDNVKQTIKQYATWYPVEPLELNSLG